MDESVAGVPPIEVVIDVGARADVDTDWDGYLANTAAVPGHHIALTLGGVVALKCAKDRGLSAGGPEDASWYA